MRRVACPACQEPVEVREAHRGEPGRRPGLTYAPHPDRRTSAPCMASGQPYMRLPDEVVALRLPADVRGIRAAPAGTRRIAEPREPGMHLGPPAPCGCQPYFTESPMAMTVITCTRGEDCVNYQTMRAAHEALGATTRPEQRGRRA